MKPLFFFGSLRDLDLLETVLGRRVAPEDLLAARAEDHAALTLAHESYPHLAHRPGAQAEGVVVRNLSGDDRARLEYFEDVEYGLAEISVETDQGRQDTVYFAASPDLDGKTSDLPWDFAAWQRDEKALAIEAAVELMEYLGIVSIEDSGAIWGGIKTRATMRVRAKAETPVTGRLRAPRSAEDVETLKIDRPYTRFFAVEDHHLRHRRFDGTMSPVLVRSALTSGDAVTVIPFDPRSGRVLLIEQFRAPMHARGDACPWGIEAIAGRIDKERDAEACARREAQEEAGLKLGRLEQVAAYYSSPGIAAEHITSFIGEAVLTDAGGLHGVADEHEDIRAFTCTLNEALAAVATGEINNAPAILSLLWLGQNRERLSAIWA